MVMDSTQVINGTFGTVWHEGEWQMNIQSAEAQVEIGKQEIPRAGTRWIGHKTMSLTGTGSIKGFKLTSKFIKLIGAVAKDNGKPYVTELIYKLDDPETLMAERIRLKGVQFDRIPLSTFEVNSLVEEELPFTFSGYDLLDEIK